MQTPQNVSETFRTRLSERQWQLRRRLKTEALAIRERPGLPAPLLARVRAHNTQAADLDKRQAAYIEAVAALPLSMGQRTANAAGIFDRAASLRAERYDLAATHIDLLAVRGELLGELAAVVRQERIEAATALGKAGEAADQALRNAGITAEGLTRPEAGPQAQAAVFAHRVAEAEPVKIAQATVDTLRVEADAIIEGVNAVTHDTEIVGQELIAAFNAIVGPVA